MNASQISREFIRVCESDRCKTVQVLRITGDSPSRPTTYWRVVLRLPPDASRTVVLKARREVLKNPKHFATCAECRELNPVGWMHDEEICQACAQGRHGVVY